MARNFKEIIQHRRSYYALSNKSTISNDEIEQILDFALKYIPSAFNSQTARIVLLLGENHTKLWNITKEVLKKITSPEAFVNTEKKIDTSFASGYGTVLFFEDNSIVENFQKNFPTYKDRFPIWSEHTSAMHQFVIWTMLEDAGFGASLQHYNPLIDENVKKEWNINPKWRLIAQLPFGKPLDEPEPKELSSTADRLLVFK